MFMQPHLRQSRATFRYTGILPCHPTKLVGWVPLFSTMQVCDRNVTSLGPHSWSITLIEQCDRGRILHKTCRIHLYSNPFESLCCVILRHRTAIQRLFDNRSQKRPLSHSQGTKMEGTPFGSLDVEKSAYKVENVSGDGKYAEELGGDLQVFQSGSDSESIKLAGDGRTVLIPQPSDDPDDPLNWSWKKKHVSSSCSYGIGASSLMVRRVERTVYHSRSTSITIGLYFQLLQANDILIDRSSLCNTFFALDGLWNGLWFRPLRSTSS